MGSQPPHAANNVNGVGNVGRAEVLTMKHPSLLVIEDAMVRKIVTELKPFDNLYYEICNEPYFYIIDSAPQQRSLSVELPKGVYDQSWLDTKTGTIKKARIHHGGGERVFQSPIYSEDVVLR